MAAHPLLGHLSVEQSAKQIRHYRYAEERMMRIMGGWIALTPELSAKILLGRHVWDCAQHADLWGKRLPELRAPAQRSEPPNEPFVQFLDFLESPEAFHQTPERLQGIYGVLKPHLLATYEDHLAHANAVYEPPTRRILQRTIEEERRHIAAGRFILSRFLRSPEVEERACAWQVRLERMLEEADGVTGTRSASLRSPEVPPASPEITQDLVALEQRLGAWPVPPELNGAVEAHARSLLRRDLQALERDLAPDYRETGSAVYAALPPVEFNSHQVVGFAKVGHHRLVKLRLDGPTGVVVLHLRWAHQRERWEVREVEVIRTEGIAGS